MTVSNTGELGAIQTQTQQYKILIADITADRLVNTINVAKQVAELNIFEDIEKPYLTGSILIVDDSGLMDDINFAGTETIEVKIAGVQNQSFVVFERTFAMVNVEKIVHTNDKTQVYMINLIDTYAFDNWANKFSKSFTGKLEDIITGMCVSELGVKVDRTFSQDDINTTTSVQPNVKVVIPYLTAIEGADWLRDKATTENGSPFFLHASMHDKKVDGPLIRLSNLDQLLRQDSFNAKIPYTYSQATTQSSVELDETNKAFVVQDVQINNVNNTLKMIQQGAIASSFSNTDIGSTTNLETLYDIDETLDRLQAAEVIRSTSKQNVFDSKHLYHHRVRGDDAIINHPSKYYHEISSRGTYFNYDTYNDASSRTSVKNKMKNAAIRNMLFKNMIDIEIPGTAIILGKVTVGSIISVRFLTSNNKDNKQDLNSVIDKNRSGDYMIYNTRHIWKDTEHKVVCSITKLDKRDVVL